MTYLFEEQLCAPGRFFFLLIIKKTRRELELILACQNADERADGVALHYYQQNGQGSL